MKDTLSLLYILCQKFSFPNSENAIFNSFACKDLCHDLIDLVTLFCQCWTHLERKVDGVVRSFCRWLAAANLTGPIITS